MRRLPNVDRVLADPEEAGHLGVGRTQAAELFGLLGVFGLVGVGAAWPSGAGACSAVFSRRGHVVKLTAAFLREPCANYAKIAEIGPGEQRAVAVLLGGL